MVHAKCEILAASRKELRIARVTECRNLNMRKEFQVLKQKFAQVKTPDADIPVLAVEFVLIRPKAMQSSRMTESYAPSAKTMCENPREGKSRKQITAQMQQISKPEGLK